MEADLVFRCRACRGQLFTSAETGALQSTSCCDSGRELRGLAEHQLPGWVRQQVDAVGWTRGRLACPGCGAKLGAFDFVGGGTCQCRATALPAVRLVRSRVDEMPAAAAAAARVLSR